MLIVSSVVSMGMRMLPLCTVFQVRGKGANLSSTFNACKNISGWNLVFTFTIVLEHVDEYIGD